MPTRNELIKQRKKELLAMGYMPGIVDKAMEWADGCAQGIANYALDLDDSKSEREQLVIQLLPTYLKDCETWIRSFGHSPGETSPKP